MWQQITEGIAKGLYEYTIILSATSSIDTMLDIILCLKKVTMAYENYDTEIVAKHHVHLVSWPEDVELKSLLKLGSLEACIKVWYPRMCSHTDLFMQVHNWRMQIGQIEWSADAVDPLQMVRLVPRNHLQILWAS